MHGLHLTADLYHCQCAGALLTDTATLRAKLLQSVAACGLQGVAELFHTFPATSHGPGGITGTVLLAESHLCVHTWPEQRAVTLDVYVCNFTQNHSTKAEALMHALLALFAPLHAHQHRLARGTPLQPDPDLNLKP